MRIRNGSAILEVTKGAYREIYMHLGWIPVGESKITPKNEAIPVGINPQDEMKEEPGEDLEVDKEEYISEDSSEDELEEKPLSMMSFDELKEYASRLNIDTTGIRSKKEIRILIRQHM